MTAITRGGEAPAKQLLPRPTHRAPRAGGIPSQDILCLFTAHLEKLKTTYKGHLPDFGNVLFP